MQTPTVPLALAHALLPSEHARPVPGASRYWITDHGRCFSLVYGKIRELKPTPNTTRYLQLELWRDDGEGEGRRWRPLVHVVVLLAFRGPRPCVPGIAYEIDHIDGDKRNNRIENLEYVRRSENMHRAISKGLHPAKLTDEGVRELRRRGHEDEADAIAWAEEAFGVTRQTARDALAGRTWRWVSFLGERKQDAAELPLAA